MTPFAKDDGRSKAWMAQAECVGQDPLVYDTDDDFKPSPEIRCFLCPVRAECLSYALDGHELGTWGGMSRKQRERISSRKRKRRTCPNEECKSLDIYNKFGIGSCARCGVSWYTQPVLRKGVNRRAVLVNPAEV